MIGQSRTCRPCDLVSAIRYRLTGRILLRHVYSTDETPLWERPTHDRTFFDVVSRLRIQGRLVWKGLVAPRYESFSHRPPPFLEGPRAHRAWTRSPLDLSS